jgi:hypothetical protein
MVLWKKRYSCLLSDYADFAGEKIFVFLKRTVEKSSY